MSSPAVASVAVINLTQFKLDLAVQSALQKAWVLAEGRSINAGHLIKGALLEARSRSSRAFVKVGTLLRLSNLVEIKSIDLPPADLAALSVTKPLADSFAIAEGFFKEGGVVWGRDYVTVGLLAKDDPSLAQIESEASVKIQNVRDQWFNFVAEAQERRTRDAWQRWWRAAGVPLPATEKTSSPAGYLFTWNPQQYPFPELERHIEQLLKEHFTVVRWSTGNRSDIPPGTRVFLIREGTDLAGLVGVGEVQGSVIQAPHWDPAKAKEGAKSFLVDVRWTALSRQPFLDLSSLIQQTGNPSIWYSPGGVLLPPDVAQKGEEIWPRAWAEHLQSLQALPEVQTKEWIARFNADLGKTDDSLKLERYINAFARVMASRNLAPPLSIGLFGDWGSGKSFFMDRLYDKIHSLSLKEILPGEVPLYWQKICQIRFNAWHYAETNLWASLVSTIFNELRFFLDGHTEDADEFNKLLNQLELAGELRKEAEQKVRDAAHKYSEAHSRVADAERQLRDLPPPPKLSDKELRTILAKNITEVVKGTDTNTVVELLESASEWSGRPEFKEGAARIKSGEQTVEAASALLDEAHALSSKAGFWWRVVSGARLYRTPSFWAVILALLLIPAIGILVSVKAKDSWANLWALIGEAITAAGAIVTWIRSRLGGATRVFDRLSSLQANVARSIDEARNRDRRAYEEARDDAAGKERAARAHLEQMRHEEQRAAEAEHKAHEALRDSTSQARLGRFIRERASSADYEKHLGLIAMIHRDFERLSELMQKAQEKTPGAVALQLNPAPQPASIAPQPDETTLPRIDRIILYIDDLDRCYPPEKVVKVLEAVHLLLFFPLFVVVVGVDSRWVSRSLHRHYEGMLADEAVGSAHDARYRERAPAESQDFLEKIFQVPFWLRRMEPVAVQRLIHNLISSSEVEAAPAILAPPVAAGGAPNATMPDLAGTRDLEINAPSTVADDPGRAAAKQITSEAESDHATSGEVVEPPSEALRITEAELIFMDKVAPLMPRTPRSVKRFVNIYRLYKATLSPLALARFLGTPAKPGNFKSVQVLLALVTGTPRLAQRVFEELQGTKGASTRRLSDLGNIGKDEETWQTTLEALREFAHGENDLRLDALLEVAPLVARYSVHHMVSAAPGEAGLG